MSRQTSFPFIIVIAALILSGGIVSLSILPVRADTLITIRGKVTLPDGTAGRLAAVWLEGGVRPTPVKNARIDQRNKTFLPHVLVVTPGTTVEFPNNDTVFHNVFAYFEAKRFDLGMYPRGATKRETFPKPGIVSVLCNVHPKMSAFIVIVDTPFYAVTTGSGEFQIPKVPPGKYTLRGWHESGATLERSVTIGSETSPFALTLEKR